MIILLNEKLIFTTKSKETRNNILAHIPACIFYESLVPTFGNQSLIMLTYQNGPNVGIKFL